MSRIELTPAQQYAIARALIVAAEVYDRDALVFATQAHQGSLAGLFRQQAIDARELSEAFENAGVVELH